MCTEAHALPTITRKVIIIMMMMIIVIVNEKMEVDGSEEQHPVSSSGPQLCSHTMETCFLKDDIDVDGLFLGLQGTVVP